MTVMKRENTVLIIEDSSKVGYGGGQKVTECVVGALSGSYQMYLVDFVRESPVRGRLSQCISGYHPLRPNGKIVGNQSSYNLSMIELVTFPGFFIWNIVSLAFWYRSVGRPSTVYCVTKKALLYGIVLKMLWGPRLIYHSHTVSPKNSRLAKLFNQLACRFCDSIIAVSNYVGGEWQCSGKVRVVLNPAADVNAEEIGVRAIGHTVIVGFVGALVPIKGVEKFGRLAAEFNKSQDGRCAFYVYGRNVHKIELPDSLVYKGFVGGEDMYSEMDILMVCSESPESFGMTALEAQCYGVPVIAPDMGAFPEVVIHGRSGFLYDTEGAMGSCLEKLLDAETYRRFSLGAISNSKHFSREEFSKRLRLVFGD